jgi:excisionase family DNA binding protein
MTGFNFPEVLTVAEVAVRLRCSKAHVCNAINGRVKGVTPLPAVSMGRRKLIRAAALANWLTENEPCDAMILASSGIGAVDASKGKRDA